MKAIILCSVLATLGAVLAEPPVRNYLPPTTNGGNGYPSNGGAPGGGYPGSNGGVSGGYPGSNGGASGGYPGAAGAPGADEGPSEPANYEFKYEVKDEATNTDFGHQESRQGDVAKGRYYVLLPDGRKQIVEYTADENGYKPQITYEGEATPAPSGATGSAAGGYPSGPAGGYPNNRPSGGSNNGANGYPSTPAGGYPNNRPSGGYPSAGGAPPPPPSSSNGYQGTGNNGYPSGNGNFGPDGYRY